MYFHWIVFTLLIVIGGMVTQMQHQDTQSADTATLDSLSRGILVYRSAAAEFARANPDYSGTPPDSALLLPEWYNKPVGVTAYLVAGSSYTYYPHPLPGLTSALAELTESIAIGSNDRGVLVSPKSVNTGLILPAPVPYGAVVAVN